MLLIWLPNVVWQIANGFPTVTYVLNHQGDIRSGGGVFDFLLLFLVLLFLLAPLWVAGFVSLFRNPALRAIGIACATPMVVYLFVGKFYYPSPTIAIVMAAGLLALSRVERRTLRSTLVVAVVVASVLDGIVLLKITVPITPADRLHATGLDTQNTDFASTVGWVSITGQMTAVYAALSPSERATTVIVSSDYGVVGALQIYGNSKLLPASYSPQLSDYYWLPSHLGATRCAHGWLCAIRCRLDVHLSDDRCASRRAVSRREPRAGEPGHFLQPERTTANAMGTAAGFLLTRSTAATYDAHDVDQRSG